MGWIGLGWVGFDSVGLGGVESGQEVFQNFHGSGWVPLTPTRPDPTRPGPRGLNPPVSSPDQHSSGLSIVPVCRASQQKIPALLYRQAARLIAHWLIPSVCAKTISQSLYKKNIYIYIGHYRETTAVPPRLPLTPSPSFLTPTPTRQTPRRAPRLAQAMPLPGR